MAEKGSDTHLTVSRHSACIARKTPSDSSPWAGMCARSLFKEMRIPAEDERICVSFIF